MTILIDLNPQAIFDSINSRNGTSILSEEVTLVLQPESGLTWLAEAGLGNTVLRIDALPTGRYSGDVLVAYDRIDATDMGAMVGNFLGIPDNITTIHAALPYFEERYGMVMYAEDWEDGAITWTEETGATWTMTASDESLTYIGSTAFRSIHLPEELGDLISDKALRSYEILREIGTQYFAEGLVYGIDFSLIQPALSSMTVSNYAPSELAALLNPNTSIVWSANDNTDPEAGPLSVDLVGSLYNSTLEYNGVNSGYSITNQSFKYVMVVGIRTDSNVVIGSLIIHYNDEADQQ